VATEPVGYCREIERYLCKKNDGHLIRVVGPSFEIVSKWEADGIPLKVAFTGIDRCFERYYRRGPRRRPVRIDFCEADVLDVFDEWRRAIGLAGAGEEGSKPAEESRSLPAHLERALLRLTSAHVRGKDAQLEGFLDRISHELDAARASAKGLRGEARRALIERLRDMDAELLRTGRTMIGESERQEIEREADVELAGFRDGMSADAYVRAREAAIGALVRQRLGLPTLIFG
jgi:hypothetical protein